MCINVWGVHDISFRIEHSSFLKILQCIELYIDGDGDGDQRIGFYSLEMAADLELDPKPHHIIAFEDAGDCKNFCYIINAHMEMLGNGSAFVVPQKPKVSSQTSCS